MPKASQDSTFSILNKASISPAAVPDACRATMQLACDAPVNSRVSAHANKHPLQPMAKLVQKELSFSTLLSVLHGHAGKVSHKSDQRCLYSPGTGHVYSLQFIDKRNTKVCRLKELHVQCGPPLAPPPLGTFPVFQCAAEHSLAMATRCTKCCCNA